MIVTIAALGGIGYWAFRMTRQAGPWEEAAAALPKIRARAKQLGLPLELEQAGLVSNSGSSNAAAQYRAAFKSYEQIRSGLGELPDTQIVTAALAGTAAPAGEARLRPVGDMMMKAAEMPKVDWGRNWHQGFDVLFPEYASMKASVRLLSALAVSDTRRGQFGAALDKMRACARIGQHASQEPFLISLLVHVALDSITMRRFEAIISMKAADAGALQKIVDQIATMGPLPSLKKAVDGEIALGLASLANLKDPSQLETMMWDQASPILMRGVSPGIARDALQARFLETWCSLYPLLAEGKEQEFTQSADELVEQFTNSNNPTYKMAGQLLPVYSSAFGAVLKDQAVRVLTSAKARVLLYKLKHGSYPKSLLEAGIVDPDPFTGKPLHYLLTGGSFAIYSVGLDRRDDGGASDRKDIVVEHPLAPTKTG